MDKITYSVIGGGWRSEFYLRIAKLIPERFFVSCICVRNKKRAKEISERFDVKIAETVDELKTYPCDFIVNCINKNDISDLSFKLADDGYAVLAETPACINPEHAESLRKKFKKEYKIQIAEQFHLKPMYQAIKNVINMGIIGEPYYINISAAHDYHAMSLMRFFLNAENPKIISECTRACPILHTNFRNGEVEKKEIINSFDVIKVFEFQDKTAVYEFDGEQYFSPIRTDRLLIRGDKGEIKNNAVRYLNKDNAVVRSNIIQHTSGNLDGLYNGEITFESRVVYRPMFGGARITDEETAIAAALVKMKEYVNTGKEFYGFERALNDVIYFNGK